MYYILSSNYEIFKILHIQYLDLVYLSFIQNYQLHYTLIIKFHEDAQHSYMNILDNFNRSNLFSRCNRILNIITK